MTESPAAKSASPAGSEDQAWPEDAIEVGRILQCLVDECIELCVAVYVPPLIARPRRDSDRKRVRAAELIDFFHGRGRIEPGDLRTAAGEDQADGEQQSEAGALDCFHRI